MRLRSPVPSAAAGAPERVRLLKFLADFAFGGTERQVANLVQGLDASKFELHAGCFNSLGPLLNELRDRGVPLAEYRINCLYNHRAAKQVLRLAAYIRRARIQIVHSYGFYSNVFAIPAARLAGAPIVVASIRDTGDVWTPWQRRAQRLACRLADRILVNAEAVRKQLISEGYDPRKISVIGNGIVLPGPRPTAGGPGLHQEFGLPPGAPLVAVVSVLRRMKGIEYFLQAAQLLARRFPDARFLVVGDSVLGQEGTEERIGDGAYRAELERYARSLGLAGRLVFTGFRLDVAALLFEVSVSVLPSLSEGLSNVLLESMAVGVPVVATRVGGNPEAVDDEVTGLLVPPRNAPALADAIGRLLADPALAARLGQAGRRRVAERFSVEAMVRATEDLYLSLLPRAAGEAEQKLVGEHA